MEDSQSFPSKPTAKKNGDDLEHQGSEKSALLTQGTGPEIVYRHFQQQIRHILLCTNDAICKIILCTTLTPLIIYLSYFWLTLQTNSFPYNMTNFLEMTLDERVHLFDQWTDTFGKTYASVDFQEKKMAVFFDNCEKIALHNLANEHSYTLGMNDFGDLTRKEFQEMYSSGYMEETRDNSRRQMTGSTSSQESEIGQDLPEALDWEEKGLTTQVKSQGGCGACYIFSTLAAVESRCAIKNWPLQDLSVQSALDCLDDQSCVKGFQSHVYKYGISNHGFDPEDAYNDYSGNIEECHDDDDAIHVDALVDWGDIDTHDEEDIKMELQNGPVSTAICTTSMDWQFLDDGVVQGKSCDTLTHGVTIVGYGYDEASDSPFWKIKNSWGPSWGQGGLAKLCRGDDCGDSLFGFAAILKQVYFPICSDADNYDLQEDSSQETSLVDQVLHTFMQLFK